MGFDKLPTSAEAVSRECSRCKGKYRCSAVLFVWMGQVLIVNRFTCLAQSKPVKQEVSRTAIIPVWQRDFSFSCKFLVHFSSEHHSTELND